MSRFGFGVLAPMFWGILVLWCVACGARQREGSAGRAVVIRVPEPAPENDVEEVPAVGEASPGVLQATSEAVPVDADDIVWGAPNAPVTIVGFQDLQCPFCARVQPTLDQLAALHPTGRLRFVFKHNPLPFHRQADEAARFAQAVRDVAGPVAARGFIDRAFANKNSLGANAFRRFLTELRLDVAAIEARAASGEVRASVDADMALAKRVGLNGTPSFLINGTTLTGAQPLEKFSEIVAAELESTAELARGDMSPSEVYAARVAENYVRKAPAAGAPITDAAPDLTPWQVSVAGAPSLGPRDALVTIVAFLDYQCPFCKRVEPTLADVLARYPKDVRLVVRQNPLPFHARGVPAAMLALEARAQRGDKGFFEMSKRLFERAPQLQDSDLLELAAAQKLDIARVRRAIDKSVHRRLLDADIELAANVQARSVPHFFVNGVRLSGAQPIDEFVRAIERERERALALVKRGVPRARVYAELQKDAKAPPPPESKQVVPGVASPVRGPAGARITIEIFSDFECPFCKRVNATLQALDAAYPGQIRWVFRQLPLPFHPRARPAAKLALEARAQKGDQAFWAVHDALFEALGKDDGLSDAVLLDIAQKHGLDLDKVRAVLIGSTHEATIDTDVAAANAAGITGTPAFTVNGYYLAGAQPQTAFDRLIRYAKAHPTPKPPAKAAAKTP